MARTYLTDSSVNFFIMEKFNKKFGSEVQTTHLVSELGELISAIANRNMGTNDLDDVLSEIADVRNMLDQYVFTLANGSRETTMVLEETISNIREQKIERTLDRHKLTKPDFDKDLAKKKITDGVTSGSISLNEGRRLQDLANLVSGEVTGLGDLYLSIMAKWSRSACSTIETESNVDMFFKYLFPDNAGAADDAVQGLTNRFHSKKTLRDALTDLYANGGVSETCLIRVMHTLWKKEMIYYDTMHHVVMFMYEMKESKQEE